MTNTTKKRVWCLYRVSTLGQVDQHENQNDIPMQHDACHKYLQTRPDWELTNELYEKGVSGYKKKNHEREELVKIKEAALSKQFDVLLVFMFDRIGRRTDETPVIMQFLVSQGIEIWSVNEGQRKYDTPEDELVGWLGTWLASGESRKISLRVKASKSTMYDRGLYSGGLVPYGYDAKRIGRVNKKDMPVRDLVINEDEADIVRFIFRAVVELGYGSYIIANALNKQGVKTKKGTGFWRATSIRTILRNPIYIGRMRSANELTEPFEQYRIIDDDVFYEAEKLVSGRAPKLAEERVGHLRGQIEDRGLLTGIIYCAACEQRMSFNHFIQRKKSNKGEVREYEREVYRCYTRLYHKESCSGKTTYDAKKLEEIVLCFAREFFSRVKRKPKVSMLRAAMASDKNLLDVAYKQAGKTLAKAKLDMEALEEEAIKALTGSGAYTTEMISRLLPKQQEKVEQAKAEFERLSVERKDDLQRQKDRMAEIEKIHTWAESFEQTPYAKKKMILAALIERVDVHSAENVDVHLKISAVQFLGEEEAAEAVAVNS